MKLKFLIKHFKLETSITIYVWHNFQKRLPIKLKTLEFQCITPYMYCWWLFTFQLKSLWHENLNSVQFFVAFYSLFNFNTNIENSWCEMGISGSKFAVQPKHGKCSNKWYRFVSTVDSIQRQQQKLQKALTNEVGTMECWTCTIVTITSEKKERNEQNKKHMKSTNNFYGQIKIENHQQTNNEQW